MGLLSISNFPTGFVFPVVNSNVVPLGSLECNGALISKTTYATLFSGAQLSIGNKYGESGGSFYLPDYRGRAMRGWDNGSGRDPNAGSRYADTGGVTGNNVGSMQDDRNDLLSHVHTVPFNGWPIGTSAGGLRPGYVQVDNTGNVWHSNPTDIPVNTGNNSSGSGETRMKNFNVMWCIKY